METWRQEQNSVSTSCLRAAVVRSASHPAGEHHPGAVGATSARARKSAASLAWIAALAQKRLASPAFAQPRQPLPPRRAGRREVSRQPPCWPVGGPCRQPPCWLVGGVPPVSQSAGVGRRSPPHAGSMPATPGSAGKASRYAVPASVAYRVHARRGQVPPGDRGNIRPRTPGRAPPLASPSQRAGRNNSSSVNLIRPRERGQSFLSIFSPSAG